MSYSPDILTAYESCPRRGVWSLAWTPDRLTAHSMLDAAISHGLTSTSADPGEAAGDEVMRLASDRGLAKQSHDLYASALNHGCIADIVVSAIRKPGEPPWERAQCPEPWWSSKAFLGPSNDDLRAFLTVSWWSEDREEAVIQSWHAIGEVCAFRMPLRLVVAVIGHQKYGKRTSAWSKGLMHPYNHTVRFQRTRRRNSFEGFKETFVPVMREEHAEISRESWLQSMLNDDVLREHLFVIDVPVPGMETVNRVRKLAGRKMREASQARSLPDPHLSTCHNPIDPCPYRCWLQPKWEPSEEEGFDRAIISG